MKYSRLIFALCLLFSLMSCNDDDLLNPNEQELKNSNSELSVESRQPCPDCFPIDDVVLVQKDTTLNCCIFQLTVNVPIAGCPYAVEVDGDLFDYVTYADNQVEIEVCDGDTPLLQIYNFNYDTVCYEQELDCNGVCCENVRISEVSNLPNAEGCCDIVIKTRNFGTCPIYLFGLPASPVLVPPGTLLISDVILCDDTALIIAGPDMNDDSVVCDFLGIFCDDDCCANVSLSSERLPAQQTIGCCTNRITATNNSTCDMVLYNGSGSVVPVPAGQTVVLDVFTCGKGGPFSTNNTYSLGTDTNPANRCDQIILTCK